MARICNPAPDRPAPFTVVPLSPDRWDDLVDLFGPRGADAGCWCMYFRMPSRDWSWDRGDRNKDDLHGLAEGDPAPGLLAYDGTQAVGWVGLGPRTSFPRLVRSRKYAALDNRAVWSVVCFFIRKSSRGSGVGGHLLGGAIDYGHEHGAAGLEGYVVDPAERMPDANAYHGTVSMFERAGFRRAAKVASTAGAHDRWIMRLEFDEAAKV